MTTTRDGLHPENETRLISLTRFTNSSISRRIASGERHGNSVFWAAPWRMDFISRAEAPIASGGMAQVFLASIDGPDGFSKKCAIKTVLPEFFCGAAAHPTRKGVFAVTAGLAEQLLDRRHGLTLEQVSGCGRDEVEYLLWV